ncbi:hypothetical protein [Streptomyces sp. STCH 565 A]|uniref:hypothetical protein n=1 Tax=Streptomyces sp. STCH 565 A TaxID=2950532 RepID=UPI0020755F74|nr:hypothetical protein [Streptomyces sp. STCH 565 A]MCM8555356.1 hypothetical protein [Streptomyces sp. STCH 565 A]
MNGAPASEEPCPDCQAGPDDNAATVTKAKRDPDTGTLTATVTWHHADCPTYTVEQILLEDGMDRAKRDEARGREALPAAYTRMIERIARGSAADLSERTMPFAEALVELVEAQLADMGRYLAPYQMAEILEKYFPPDEEPTA